MVTPNLSRPPRAVKPARSDVEAGLRSAVYAVLVRHGVRVDGPAVAEHVGRIIDAHARRPAVVRQSPTLAVPVAGGSLAGVA